MLPINLLTYYLFKKSTGKQMYVRRNTMFIINVQVSLMYSMDGEPIYPIRLYELVG
jgi:hypothetical protein